MTTNFTPVRILGIIPEEIGTPQNDGSPGSGLYGVPFRLSAHPPHEWGQFFVQTWNRPPRFSTMHRSGIASVIGDKVFLNRTTVEEVEKYHKETLLLAVSEANRLYVEHRAQQKVQAQREAERVRKYQDEVRARAKGIKFD